MPITLPELALVVLIGPSGSGKSTFARAHFRPTEVISSDFCRALVADDENDQSATSDAFEVLSAIASRRLRAGRLTVIDATNVQADARRPLLALAREHDVLPVAIVFHLPEHICHDRNLLRPDRNFGPHVIRRQSQDLRRSLGGLQREGFRHVFILDSPQAVAAATIERQPLWNNRRHDTGPFDLIGDVHGCRAELEELLLKLGYEQGDAGAVGPGDREIGQGALHAPLIPVSASGASGPAPVSASGASGPASVSASAASGPPWRHPAGRKAVFLGDLVDRGPDTPGVLRLVMEMVAAGSALCVPGNHDNKLLRKLKGRDVQISHGLAESLEQLGREPPEFVAQVVAFLDSLVGHYLLDGGRLVVAHAGLKERYQGRASGRVRDFALYGETTGETDEYGLPVRHNWAAEYRGAATVVYGHTPVPEPDWLNRTINIDTGCVFGGRLTALRYPERELVSVPARQVYAEPKRPIQPIARPLTAQQAHDELLDIDDVLGRRHVSTRLRGKITIREEHALAALEVMGRFAADPRWLIYLPPTMSPCETSREPGLLEHPAGAFSYYAAQGVTQLICEEKHMGSRAVAIVCRDEDAARRRFGVLDGGIGIVYTRTGRRFFEDAALEAALLARVRDAAGAAGLWAELETDWLCLDCELLPWSAKAQELLRRQYAAVGAAGGAALGAALAAIGQAQAQATDAQLQADLAALEARYGARRAALDRFTAAYGRYCWPVRGLEDLRLAPFHLLASHGATHHERDHLWHMQTLARLAAAGPALLIATEHRRVSLEDPASVAAATAWWFDITERGGEGMVVKPLDFVVHGPKGLVQPAVKVRGREYLRIIYGPEYDAPEHLDRLRQRGLSAKRGLALQEFALGIEALDRFVRGEPLRHVHECVFAVLAMESEPVDPRL